jgi:hypothetical protein
VAAAIEIGAHQGHELVEAHRKFSAATRGMLGENPTFPSKGRFARRALARANALEIVTSKAFSVIWAIRRGALARHECVGKGE